MARIAGSTGVGRPTERRAPNVTNLNDRYGALIGSSPAMRNVFELINAVAESDANVLIVGESGTGKELIADALHACSLRSGRAFVKVNCSAFPADLIENELFGHVRGAYTGAGTDAPGLVAAAAGGSLLLDEIGAMSLALQPKLLRVLQERQYTQLGSRRTVKADFRLIASMNQSPEEALRTGRLRQDLYYRVSTITILAPPLRERGDDVLLLAERMLERFSAKYAKPLTGFSSDALDALIGYSWPGNVRELVSAIERAVLVSRGGVVEADGMALGGRLCSRRSISFPSGGGVVLPFGNRHTPAGDVIATRVDESSDASSRIETLAELERGAIVRALRLLKGNKTAVADSLGIYRALLYAKMRRYRLSEYLSDEDLVEPMGAVTTVAGANVDAGDGQPVERLERAIARSGRRS